MCCSIFCTHGVDFVFMWSPWLRVFSFQWKDRNMNALVAQFAACFCISMSDFMLPDSQKHKWERDPYCIKCHESLSKTPLLKAGLVKIQINDCAMSIRMQIVYVCLFSHKTFQHFHNNNLWPFCFLLSLITYLLVEIRIALCGGYFK